MQSNFFAVTAKHCVQYYTLCWLTHQRYSLCTWRLYVLDSHDAVQTPMIDFSFDDITDTQLQLQAHTHQALLGEPLAIAGWNEHDRKT